MAETATEGQYTEAPPRPFSSLDRVAAETAGAAPPMTLPTTEGAMAKIAEARAAERQGLEDKAAGMKPAYQAVMDAGAKREASATALMPQKPTLQEPPSRGLRDFLAPSENETPMNSIMKLVQAMSLFIGGASGAVRGDGVGALAAFTGALTGWQQGDAERADRAYKDWQAKTDKALHQYSLDRKEYEDIMLAADKTLAQKIAEAKIKAMELGDDQAVKAFDSDSAMEWYTLANDRDKHRDQLKQRRDELDVRVQEATEARKAREAQMAETARHHRAQEARWAAEDKRADDAAASYTPEDFKMLGQRYAMTGTLPPNIARGKTGQMLLPKIIAGAREWAKEQGIDPMTFPSIQAAVKSAGVALNDTQKRKNVALASVGTFERHMDQLVDLGSKVPRSEMPAVNKAIVEGQRQFGGSVAASNYVLMAFEAAQEFAKISVGTAQGDAGTREEARKALSTAMTQEQLVGARDTLKQAAAQRVRGWEDAENDMLRIIGTAGKDRTTTAGGGGAKKRTVTLPNGKTVTVEEQ